MLLPIHIPKPFGPDMLLAGTDEVKARAKAKAAEARAKKKAKEKANEAALPLRAVRKVVRGHPRVVTQEDGMTVDLEALLYFIRSRPRVLVVADQLLEDAGLYSVDLAYPTSTCMRRLVCAR